ncbi:MAG: TadE family protein [Chloroflexota bacterium]|nr:TadE family protein [Chloroflexota bacterium]
MLKAEKGQSVVELALLLPILMIILTGVVDLGRAFNAYITITNAAREGARYGSLNPTDTNGIKARVMGEAAGSGVSVEEGDIPAPTCDPSCEPGNTICVEVHHDFPLLTGFVVSGGAIQLVSSAEMVILGE